MKSASRSDRIQSSGRAWLYVSNFGCTWDVMRRMIVLNFFSFFVSFVQFLYLHLNKKLLRIYFNFFLWFLHSLMPRGLLLTLTSSVNQHRDHFLLLQEF